MRLTHALHQLQLPGKLRGSAVPRLSLFLLTPSLPTPMPPPGDVLLKDFLDSGGSSKGTGGRAGSRSGTTHLLFAFKRGGASPPAKVQQVRERAPQGLPAAACCCRRRLHPHESPAARPAHTSTYIACPLVHRRMWATACCGP